MIGPIAIILSSLVTTVTLINACHNCAVQVTQFSPLSGHGFSVSATLQKTKLITNIEKLTFWIGDNQDLHIAKQALLLQISNLDISINGNHFFIIDRKFLAGVSVVCNQ